MKTALLETMYDRALGGLPVLGKPSDVAARWGGSSASLEQSTKRLVRVYIGLCGATGFACGLPGFLLLPVTVPANLAGVAALQLHMTAAIAVLAGREVTDEVTRSECVACLLEKLADEGTNTEEQELVARTGIKFAERGTRFALGHVSSLTERAARFAVMRRLGLSKLPLIGGVLGAGSDAYMTNYVARQAVHRFGGAKADLEQISNS